MTNNPSSRFAFLTAIIDGAERALCLDSELIISVLEIDAETSLIKTDEEEYIVAMTVNEVMIQISNAETPGHDFIFYPLNYDN